MYSLLWRRPMQPDVETSNIERAIKTVRTLCCMYPSNHLNDMKITPTQGSVETDLQIVPTCLNDARATPSASDDEPYEC
tara:strand:+ start:891 stop:1127 length:237 start_codon:yes stop_codon:yes gene_type:complete